ncbi:hypothetical protein [Nocardia sp. NPDC059239]|uniref:hypothetical protein n=1 Tax=unclassified Nocardia TaxID=2637762 RepID=UPI0036CC017E
MFLLRRNLPLAWGGWYDNFTKYGVQSVVQPWVHLGDGTPGNFTAENWLHIPSNAGSTNAGGESYEYQPFTPNWGFETEIWFPVEGLAAQVFSVYFTDSWSKIGATFQNCAGIRLIHQPAAGGEMVQYAQFDSPWSVVGNNILWSSPVTYYGQWVTLSIWVDNDEWVRVWINGTYVGSAQFSPGFTFGPTRRCVRFLDAALCDVWLRWVDHYDRPSSIPSKNVWNQIFSDDFNRADGAVGNGWTQVGTNAGIVSNSWSTTGTTNGGKGLIRDTGLTSGRVRVEATIGGNLAPSTASDNGLVLCSNATGTQGIAANIFQNKIYMSRFTSALSDDQPAFTDYRMIDYGIAISSGDRIAVSVYNGIGWIEINGVPKLYIGNVHADVPATNQYAGLRVTRRSGNDSASWNDVQIYSGLG